MFHVCPAAPRDIETATDYHEEGEGNRTRSFSTGPAEQEEGGSLETHTQSQYLFIQIIVVCDRVCSRDDNVHQHPAMANMIQTGRRERSLTGPGQ